MRVISRHVYSQPHFIYKGFLRWLRTVETKRVPNQLTEGIQADGELVLNLLSSKVSYQQRTKSGFNLTWATNSYTWLSCFNRLTTNTPYRVSLTAHRFASSQRSLVVCKVTTTPGVSWFHEVQLPLMPCTPWHIGILQNTTASGAMVEATVKVYGIEAAKHPFLAFFVTSR